MKTMRPCVTKDDYAHAARRARNSTGWWFFSSGCPRARKKKKKIKPTQSVHVRPKGTNLVYKTYNNDIPAVILFFRHFRVIHQLATCTGIIYYRQVRGENKIKCDRGGWRVQGSYRIIRVYLYIYYTNICDRFVRPCVYNAWCILCVFFFLSFSSLIGTRSWAVDIRGKWRSKTAVYIAVRMWVYGYCSE